jgi:hypothetical protein
VCSQKTGRKGVIQLEEAYILDVMKLMEYAESKADPLIQTVRTHKQKQNQKYHRMLETSRKNYKKTHKRHHNREDKKKRWQGRRIMDKSHVAWISG